MRASDYVFELVHFIHLNLVILVASSDRSALKFKIIILNPLQGL